ncbi:hypothetical protein [Pedobacter yulinensis]|nr:hypothetical protein [Pedobacter yulinensis]
MENIENNTYNPADHEDSPGSSPLNSNIDQAKAVASKTSGEGDEPVRRETEEADREILAGTDDSRIKTGPANADAAERDEFMRSDAEALPEEDEEYALGIGSGDDPTQNEEDDLSAGTDDVD